MAAGNVLRTMGTALLLTMGGGMVNEAAAQLYPAPGIKRVETEQYNLSALTIVYDQQEGNFRADLRAAKRDDNDPNALDKMHMSFGTNRGGAPNFNGNTNTVKVKSIQYLSDPLRDNIAQVELEIAPDDHVRHGASFRVVPETTDGETNVYDIGTLRLVGTIPLNLIDARTHRPFSQPDAAARSLVGETSYTGFLMTQFRGNNFAEFDKDRGRTFWQGFYPAPAPSR